MEKRMMYYVIAGVLIILLVFGFFMVRNNRNENIPSEIKIYCDVDSECVCGGKDKQTGECFIGNADYYDKYVDQSQSCPDFCTGIAGNLETKCVDHVCVSQNAGSAGIANPASVYCVEHGGELEIVTDSSGGQQGICKFQNGTECEEWKLFRGEC